MHPAVEFWRVQCYIFVMSIQGLDLLREHAVSVFNQEYISLSYLQHLFEHLHWVNAHSMGLGERISTMNREMSWDFEDLFSHPSVHIKLLMIPQGNHIPIHDHPEMHVFLKCIWGHMKVESFDWLQEAKGEPLAHKTSEVILNGASEPIAITPSFQNMHRITAIQDCAFIDICSPFYDEENGRPCTYYSEEPIGVREGQEIFKLNHRT